MFFCSSLLEVLLFCPFAQLVLQLGLKFRLFATVRNRGKIELDVVAL